MSLPSTIVWNRPHLLENYIRAQFIDVFGPDTRDEYSAEDREEAFQCIDRLAALRHVEPSDILALINPENS